MKIPGFFVNNDSYHEDLNQTLQLNLSENGWRIPQVTHNELVGQTFVDPENGQSTTLDAYMPNGTLWYVTDASPPTLVAKINGNLQKISTTNYP